ncbi:MAG: hypothetical protein KDK27_13720 [Leptospiraceae bacterium]|nr:hypothetical protein [Leptospiraceae bacterium]
MISRFFRSFFWAVLVGFVAVWLHFGFVSASTHEAIVIEDLYEGYTEEVIQPGDARFISNRIFPGRVTLHPVRISPRLISLHYRQPLEQSEMLGLDSSFYIQADLRMDYELRPNQVRTLFQKLDQPDWNRLEPYLKTRIQYILQRNIREAYYTNDNDLPGLQAELHDYLSGGDALAQLNAAFVGEGVVFKDILPVRVYVPDLNRYRAMLNAGGDILQAKLERIRTIDQAEAQQDAQKIKDQAYFARLERVGELLRRYPHLKEYLAVDRLSDNVEVIIMPDDRWFGRAQTADDLSSRPILPSNRNALPIPDNAPPFLERGGRNGNQFQDLTPR